MNLGNDPCHHSKSFFITVLIVINLLIKIAKKVNSLPTGCGFGSCFGLRTSEDQDVQSSPERSGLSFGTAGEHDYESINNYQNDLTSTSQESSGESSVVEEDPYLPAMDTDKGNSKSADFFDNCHGDVQTFTGALLNEFYLDRNLDVIHVRRGHTLDLNPSSNRFG
ncbi:hypothetical protein RF11_15095 [Thelohanellus kitauei]|uniref:Uncharacterized protein n=1 Tax=Thelohanellus kitauei TaxID=669202 RepID=A0A0C2IC54_THEKT|nr:hypothetical protein RF11_15095 [Thelohanellus kitauei]